MHSNLLFQEELFLCLYRRFFGHTYDCYDSKTEKHGYVQKWINGQNMMYFFSCLGVPVNHGFSWNTFGPSSGTLRIMMRELDEKKGAVRNWYYDEQKETLSELIGEDLVRTVDNACVTMHEMVNIPYGTELMADMLYLSTNVMKNYGFESVLAELRRRKKSFTAPTWNGPLPLDSQCRIIWNKLVQLSLVPDMP